MAHQFDVLSGQNGDGLSRCVRACLVMLNKDSSSLVRFWNYSEDLRQTNSDVSLRIDRATMLKWNCCHLTSFVEEIGDQLLRSAASTNNFHWFVSVSKTHTLDSCFVSGSYAQIHVSSAVTIL